MSTSSNSNSHRSYPISPPPHSAAELPDKMAFQHPQTPKSPSQPASASVEKTSPIDIPKQSTGSAFPTPANSTSGSAPQSAVIEAIVATSHDFSGDIEDSSNKRKRDIQDSGEREQKKVHVEDRRLGIEDLHLDVGKKYLLCRTRKAPTSSYCLYAFNMAFKPYLSQVFCTSFTAVFG